MTWWRAREQREGGRCVVPLLAEIVIRLTALTKAILTRLDKGETEYGAFNGGDNDENGFKAT